MYEKKFINYLISNDIDYNLLIAESSQEKTKFRALLNNSIVINTKTLMPVRKYFRETKTGNVAFYFKQSEYDNVVFQKGICLLATSINININKCEKCDISTMDLCVFNNIYKYDCIFVNKGENK